MIYNFQLFANGKKMEKIYNPINNFNTVIHIMHKIKLKEIYKLKVCKLKNL